MDSAFAPKRDLLPGGEKSRRRDSGGRIRPKIQTAPETSSQTAFWNQEKYKKNKPLSDDKLSKSYQCVVMDSAFANTGYLKAVCRYGSGGGRISA